MDEPEVVRVIVLIVVDAVNEKDTLVLVKVTEISVCETVVDVVVIV